MGRPRSIGLAEAIEDAADQFGSHGDAGVLPPGDDAVVQLNAVDLFEGHRKYVAVAEPDHLGANACGRTR